MGSIQRFPNWAAPRLATGKGVQGGAARDQGFVGGRWGAVGVPAESGSSGVKVTILSGKGWAHRADDLADLPDPVVPHGLVEGHLPERG